MRALVNLSFRNKVIGAFAAVVAFTLVLGGFSINRIMSLNASTAFLQQNVVTDQPLAVIAKDAAQVQALAGDAHLLADPSQTVQIADAESQAASLEQAEDHAKHEFSAAWTFYQPTMDPGRETADGTGFSTAFTQMVALAGKAAADDAADNHAAAAAALSGPMQREMASFTKSMDDDVAYQIWQYNGRTNDAYAASASAILWILAILGIMAAATVVIGWLMVKGIATPIAAMTLAMGRLSSQDFSVAIPGIGRRDEVGAMADAVRVFKENGLHAQTLEREQREANARRALEDEQVRRDTQAAAAALVVGSIGKGLEALSSGDLMFRLSAELPEAYENLRLDFNAAMEQVADLVRKIVTITALINSGSNDIARGADDLSQRTKQQAGSLEQSAAALEQLTTTVRRTAESAMKVSIVVARTKADAQQSGEIVRKANGAMVNIERSSSEITQIIGVIDEIAFQTNLLALNAGVEAARAGDSGRGFAVVASEVRALAQRSAEAAKQIKTLIATSAGEVGTGVGLVGEASKSLDRIVSQVTEITVSVTEMAQSAQEQATGLHDVNAAVNHMDRVTQQNAAMVEESTAASHALDQETAELLRLTQGFQVDAAAAAGASSSTKGRSAGKRPLHAV